MGKAEMKSKSKSWLSVPVYIASSTKNATF